MIYRFFTTLFFSLLTFSIFAQRDVADAKKIFWGNTSKAYQNRTVPEKWADESAVILYQKIGYDYDRIRRKQKLQASSYYHARVVLQDKAAVKEFSEFNFTETFSGGKGYARLRGGSQVGFKIIKPDGTAKEVDLDNAVEVDEGSNNGTKKIAIPDLQVGDILDYYYQIDEQFNIMNFHAFDPSINTLNQDYPVSHLELEFKIENNFYVYFQSLNGAPELEDVSTDDRKIYRLTSTDIAKNTNTNWYYPYRSAPTIKFQVIFSVTPYFIGSSVPQNDDKPKNKLDQDEIMAIYSGSNLSRYYWKSLKRYLKGKDMLNVTNEKTVQEAYHWLFHQIIGSKIEELYLGETNISNKSAGAVLTELATYCSEQDISYDWLVTVPREYSDIKDVLLVGEIARILRVKIDNKMLYFSPPSLHPHFGKLDSEYENTTAYVVPKSIGLYGAKSEAETYKLPYSEMDENHTASIKNISFAEDDITTLQFQSQFTTKGHNRAYTQYQLLQPYDYTPAEMTYFDSENYTASLRTAKGREAARQQVNNLQEELDKQREESLKLLIESDFEDFEVANIHDFKLQKTGRLFEPEMQYEYAFDVNGLVSKAGPNYVVEIGQAIGDQVEIAQKDMTRTADIYMPYARSFSNQVTLNIPTGYTVTGIDKLNVNVENVTGGFTSTAKVVDNQLVIKTKKWYSHNFEPAKNWEQMLAFLEASYEFTEQKVLLKKE